LKHVIIVMIVLMRQLFIELWYSPILFARHWTAGTNKPLEHLKRKDPVSVITSVAGSFLYIYFLAWLLVVSNTQHMVGALVLAFVTWLGMILPTMIVHYERLGYPWSVVAIDSGKELVCALMTAAILVTWR
jgi:hypothetical protein